MCVHCEGVLGGFCLPHSDHQCPLRQSLFCSECSLFGHDSTDCPEKKGKRLLVVDSATEIRRTLQTLGITIKKGQSVKGVLKHYAKENGIRLVYLSPSFTEKQ